MLFAHHLKTAAIKKLIRKSRHLWMHACLLCQSTQMYVALFLEVFQAFEQRIADICQFQLLQQRILHLRLILCKKGNCR